MRRIVLLALLLACKPSPPKGALAVGQIAVSEAGLAGKPEIGESAEQLRKELQAALEGTGRFTIRGDGPVSIEMEIDRAQRIFAPVPVIGQGQSPPEREMAEVALHIEMTDSHLEVSHDLGIAYGLERITGTTEEVLRFLKQHERVERVIYPYDEQFPQFGLARRQMRGACGLMTFALREGTVASITRFCESLKHIMMAVSWGGHESLVIPKCAGMKAEDFDPSNEEHRYIRLYVGLEDAAYLIADLGQALDQA